MQIKELLKQPKILPQVELESYGDDLAHVCGKIVAFKEDWAAENSWTFQLPEVPTKMRLKIAYKTLRLIWSK